MDEWASVPFGLWQHIYLRRELPRGTTSFLNGCADSTLIHVKTVAGALDFSS